VPEQTPVAAQVEGEEVAIALKNKQSISNSNGQTGITTSDEGLRKVAISSYLLHISSLKDV